MNEPVDSFDSLAEYHDYLELFEEISKCLSHPVAIQMKPDPNHRGAELLDEYRKHKLDRKKKKEKRELQAASAALTGRHRE